MSVGEDLSRLVCGGQPLAGSTLGEILGHSQTMVTALASELESLRREALTHTTEPTRFALFGPFAGRSLLEVGLTAILGRLDPFRVLVLREMQMRPDYVPEKRSLVSIQWSGDILADKKVEDLWRIDRNIKDMTRALLGDYYEHLFWRKAFQVVLDGTSEDRGGDWMRELRRMEPDSFVSRMRQLTSSVYSSCSKGVHHEYVIPASGYYDVTTLSTILNDALKAVALLAFVANASADIHFQLPLADATECFERIQV